MHEFLNVYLELLKSKGKNKQFLESITLTRDVTSIYYCEISLPSGRNRYRIFSILEWNCLLLKNIAENWPRRKSEFNCELCHIFEKNFAVLRTIFKGSLKKVISLLYIV